MMLVWVLVLTALLASDVAEMTNTLGPEETQQDLEIHDLVKGQCDENWLYYYPSSSCYRLFSDKRTWSDAEAFCNRQHESGHLATVHSSDHNKYIINLIVAATERNERTWIGLNDRENEGTFTWIDGSSQSYRNWLSGEPNHSGNEDCVEINFRGKCNNDRNVVVLEVDSRHSIEQEVTFTDLLLHRGREPTPWVLCSAELD
ncbi:C-type lectin-like [Rhinoraja longicauda]